MTGIPAKRAVDSRTNVIPVQKGIHPRLPGAPRQPRKQSICAAPPNQSAQIRQVTSHFDNGDFEGTFPHFGD